MKQYLLVILFIPLTMFCHGQDVKKWSFGIGGGIFQAPFMKGDAIEDKYFDINYNGMLSIMSGKLFFGFSYKLCDSFSIGTDIYYESFLRKFTKPAYTNEYWVRLYNYGLNLGVKYHF